MKQVSKQDSLVGKTLFWQDPDKALCSKFVKVVDDFSDELENSETLLVEDERGCLFEVLRSEIVEK